MSPARHLWHLSNIMTMSSENSSVSNQGTLSKSYANLRPPVNIYTTDIASYKPSRHIYDTYQIHNEYIHYVFLLYGKNIGLSDMTSPRLSRSFVTSFMRITPCFTTLSYSGRFGSRHCATKR